MNVNYGGEMGSMEMNVNYGVGGEGPGDFDYHD